MNLMMNAGINQIKGQAMALIPDEMQDKENEKLQEEKDSKINAEGKGTQIKPKKQKKINPITKSVAIKMYSILLFHTLVITTCIFVFTIKFGRSYSLFRTVVSIIAIACGIILSLVVTKIKFLSKSVLVYFFYIVVLAANVIGFTYCSLLGQEKDKGAEDHYITNLIKTMFIVFDSASLTVILFSCLVKDTPSTFWLMCCSGGGCIISIVIAAKIYSDDSKLRRWGLMLFGGIACAIYESMTYNSLDDYKNNKKTESFPPFMSLPFEFNICFIKIFWYFLKIIGYLCSMCVSCCCPARRRR